MGNFKKIFRGKVVEDVYIGNDFFGITFEDGSSIKIKPDVDFICESLDSTHWRTMKVRPSLLPKAVDPNRDPPFEMIRGEWKD